MKPILATLLLLGAIGFFAFSQRDSFQAQPHGRFGFATGPPYTVTVTRTDRIGYGVAGAICLAAGLYFIAQMRRGS